jgi:hypothetical protein
MKALATATIALVFLLSLGRAGVREPAEPPAREKAAVTIWVLSYERLDGNILSDQQFLPKRIDGALTKLKDKGAKKAAFDFDQKQVAVWFEGKEAVKLTDVQEAFPGLTLKLTAKAVFPDEP